MSDVEVLGLHLSGGLVMFAIPTLGWAVGVARARHVAKAGIRRRTMDVPNGHLVARAAVAADGITRWVAYTVGVLCAYAGASAFEAVAGPWRWVLVVVALAAGTFMAMFAMSESRAARAERDTPAP